MATVRVLNRISPASICALTPALCVPRPKASSSPFHDLRACALALRIVPPSYPILSRTNAAACTVSPEPVAIAIHKTDRRIAAAQRKCIPDVHPAVASCDEAATAPDTGAQDAGHRAARQAGQALARPCPAAMIEARGASSARQYQEETL